MTIRAGLRDRINHGVIEYAIHIKLYEAVAHTTVDTRYRVTGRPPCGDRAVMTGIAALADNVRSSMVRVGRQETCGGVTEIAFSTGCYVVFVLAHSDGTVVAA